MDCTYVVLLDLSAYHRSVDDTASPQNTTSSAETENASACPHNFSDRSRSLTPVMALPNRFSPHLLRFAPADSALKPIPQILSAGDAYSTFSASPSHPRKRKGNGGCFAHLYELPVASRQQKILHLRLLLAAGELPPVALLYNAGFVCDAFSDTELHP